MEMAEKTVNEIIRELGDILAPVKVPAPKEPVSICSMLLLADVKMEIKKNPSNYSRERFLDEIEAGYYDDKSIRLLIHELEEYGLYPLIYNALKGKYTCQKLYGL